MTESYVWLTYLHSSAPNDEPKTHILDKDQQEQQQEARVKRRKTCMFSEKCVPSNHDEPIYPKTHILDKDQQEQQQQEEVKVKGRNTCTLLIRRAATVSPIKADKLGATIDILSFK